MNVDTTRDVAVDAIAWRVDPTLSGVLVGQTSSAVTQHGSSFVSSDSSNMPPGFISPAANRANAADLIRGREALRPFAASTQTAGTAVSLLPPQFADGNNPSPSVQAAFNAHHAAVNCVQSEIDAAQQVAIRDIERMVQQDQARSARLGQEYIASIVH